MRCTVCKHIVTINLSPPMIHYSFVNYVGSVTKYLAKLFTHFNTAGEN